MRGWLEHALIEPSGIALDAKLDTGARTSSINAEILSAPNGEDEARSVEEEPTPASSEPGVEVIEDESDPEIEEVAGAPTDQTIVFRIANAQGESSILQRPLVRYVEIKNRDGTTERRPVVEITACVAGVLVEGEVNLADRDDFNYPFLVGRNMLEASGIVVDAREIYTSSAGCSTPSSEH